MKELELSLSVKGVYIIDGVFPLGKTIEYGLKEIWLLYLAG